MSPQLERELAKVMATLGPRECEEVLEYVRSLQEHDDTLTPSLLDLTGTISQEDLQIMRETMEEIRVGSCRCASCSRTWALKRNHPAS